MRITKTVIFLTLLCVLSVAKAQIIERMNLTQKPRYYVIGNIISNDLEYIHKDYLINSLNLVKGDSILIPGDKIRDAYRRLWDLRHFSDVKIETDFRGDTVDISILLKENRRVAQWKFNGVPKNEEKELVEKMRLKRHQAYTDYLMETNVRLIREYYNEKGFRGAKIDFTLERDTTKWASYIVNFDISKGRRMRIKEIVVEGNDNVPTKGIVKAMKNTNKLGINIFAKTKFNDKEFANDLISAEEYMHSKGYRDAVVLEDSIFVINDRRIGVWMKVKEGQKYYFRDIKWLGNSVHTDDELNMMLQIDKGDVYDSEALNKRLGTKSNPMEQSVSVLYRDKGYLAYIIEPIEKVVGIDSIDVEIRMIEGKQFRINDVTFNGNTRTNDHVIRRELYTDPGELYSQSLLMRTYQRLASMGQFDVTTINPEPIPNFHNETVDIRYSFKEVTNDQLELSGGWGGGMFIASVGLKFSNFAVRKFFEPKSWRPYPAGDNQTLELKIQSNGTYYQAFSASFTEPWLGGRKPNSLSVYFHSSRESNAYILGQVASKFFSTTGAGVSFGKRLNWPDPYFTFSSGISATSYRMQDWDYFLFKNGFSSTVALNLSVGRNSIDDPYQYATQGSNISVSLALTPPFSAIDGQDYANKNMSEQERYRWIEYHKWKLNAQWFFPLYNRKLVLMARAQLGYLGYYNENKRSPFEGFIVGGDGLSGYNVYGTENIGLRGYENASLTPSSGYGVYASVFSKYTVEMRYPFVREGSTLVYGLAFLEAGNAFEHQRDYKPFNLKRSAGVGVRIFLPVLGMLGIDWGYGFDKASPTQANISGSQFHFSIGAQL
ncbi:Outer membrane protein assembly factor YaeT precursor [Mucinivorans hirudinis]|uniref:Outer membrane protein assembly factor YaeT n=1 Tax=Mucinivorans hirudinis TaxID=1433126 RepID=A0A060RDE6_9BACT|nr:Outer membrane protein assembly factor YaeT precursor [Mucinivorans hirudinis]